MGPLLIAFISQQGAYFVCHGGHHSGFAEYACPARDAAPAQRYAADHATAAQPASAGPRAKPGQWFRTRSKAAEVRIASEFQPSREGKPPARAKMMDVFAGMGMTVAGPPL
jgi:hypothetical protein